MTQPHDQEPRRRHPVARVLIWVLAALAVIITAWVVAMGVVMALEWPDYGDTSERLMALGFFAMYFGPFLILSWTLVWITWKVLRQR